jgi:hypothetical protein
MNPDKLESIARTQAKALKKALELYAQETYLDSNGRELWRHLDLWLEHTKPVRKSA